MTDVTPYTAGAAEAQAAAARAAAAQAAAARAAADAEAAEAAAAAAEAAQSAEASSLLRKPPKRLRPPQRQLKRELQPVRPISDTTGCYSRNRELAGSYPTIREQASTASTTIERGADHGMCGPSRCVEDRNSRPANSAEGKMMCLEDSHDGF